MKKFFSLVALLALAFPFVSCDKEDGYPEVKSGFRIDGKSLKVTSVEYSASDLAEGNFDIVGTLEDGSKFYAEANAEAYNGKKIDLTRPDPVTGTKMANEVDCSPYFVAFEDKDGRHCGVWGGPDPLVGCPGSYLKVTRGKKEGAPMKVEFRLMHMNMSDSKDYPLERSTITFKGEALSDAE